MMYWFGNDISGWGFTLMIASMVLFWGLLITGCMFLIRSSRRPEHPTPEQILAQRFARDEINEGEYRDRLTALRGSTRS